MRIATKATIVSRRFEPHRSSSSRRNVTIASGSRTSIGSTASNADVRGATAIRGTRPLPCIEESPVHARILFAARFPALSVPVHARIVALTMASAMTLAASAWAQQAPPPSKEARQIEMLVNEAAALVESRGKAAAFAQFRTRDSHWWSGNTYLFAYDENLNVLLNPAFPTREGTNVHGQTDANGKPMHDEFLKVVRKQGAGWVDYVFPKPGETKPSGKWTYVKGVKIDGTPGLIGAGFYPK
jgi:hypothetical protein